MAHRNILLNNEMLDLETEPGRTYRYQEHQISWHATNAPSYPSIHPMLSSIGSVANRNPYPLFGHYDSNIFYGNYNAGGDSSRSNWSYMPHMHDSQGRRVNGGSFEIGSISEQEYWNSMSSNNSAFFLHPSSNHHHNYHSLPVQGIQGHNYHFHHQMPAPFYRHPMNDNIHNRTRNNEAGREAMSSYPRHFYRPRRRESQYASVEITAHIRILPSEEVAILEFPSMQPHTNATSYEELLALEEQIGNVNTCLSESTIINCLKTRTQTSCTASSAHDNSLEMDQSSICVVCQVEYEENDKIGILGCGHDYHVDCIKQWLLLKNVCPMCKRPAFSVDDNEC